MQNNQTVSETTSLLCSDLTTWRNTRKPGSHIPPELWARSVEAARQDGVYRISQLLRLDYAELKRRVGEASRPTSPADDKPVTFVELLSPVASNIGHCTLRLESVRGDSVCVEMTSVPPEGLAAVLRGLRG